MQLDQSDITITTKLGNFVFSKEVRMHHAKMIRDAILGQFFNPRPNEKTIKTELDAQDYVRSHLGRDLQEVPFELTFHKQYIRKEKKSFNEVYDERSLEYV